jgi:hypothetical protein
MNAIPNDPSTPRTRGTDNRWLIAAVCICAVVLSGFAVYSYRLTASMQQVAVANGTAAASQQNSVPEKARSAPDINAPRRRGSQNTPMPGG